MESGSRELNKERPELVGSMLDVKETDVAHARLKRMAAFESHDYDPLDNDLEEEALRSRKRSEYRSEERWKWTLSAMIGITMGFVAFTVDGLIDKLNTFKFGTAQDLMKSSLGRDRCHRDRRIIPL